MKTKRPDIEYLKERIVQVLNGTLEVDLNEIYDYIVELETNISLCSGSCSRGEPHE